MGQTMQNANVAVEQVNEPVRFPQEIALSDISNATVQKGFVLWDRARNGRAFPTRVDMSPRLLSDLLRNTVLIRVLASAEDYELRIVGDAIVQAFGKSVQGMNTAEIDLIMPGLGSILHRSYDYVVDRAEPVAMRGWYYGESGDRSLFHETVLLPLAQDGRTIDHLMVFAAYAFDPTKKRR